MSSEESGPWSNYSAASECVDVASESSDSISMVIGPAQAVDSHSALLGSSKLNSSEIAKGPVTPGPLEPSPTEPSPLALKSTGMTSLEAQIAQAVEQLASGDFHSQWDYAKRFSQQFAQWGDRIISPLISQLRHQQDPDTQWFLVRILSQFEHPDVVTVLAELLVATRNEELQIEVSKALSTLGESAVSVLSEMLAIPVQEEKGDRGARLGSQRILAARTLSHIRRSAVIDPLLGITDDPDPELRAIAIEALGSFHDPRITPILLAALKDRPDICIEAIRTLGRRGDLLATTDLVSPLRQCLLVEDDTVACESAIALGRLGTEDAIAALGDQLLSPLSTPVKVAIVQSLGWLSVQSAVTYLVNAFTASAPIVMPAVKKEIARALGQTRNPQTPASTTPASIGQSLKSIAAKPLINWLSTAQLDSADAPPSAAESKGPAELESFLLAQTVLSALARLGTADALGSLIPLLSNPDPRLRLHALSALKQIDPSAAQAKAQRYLHRADLSPVKKQYVAETLAAW